MIDAGSVVRVLHGGPPSHHTWEAGRGGAGNREIVQS